MSLLHPYFLIAIFFLLIFSYQEVFQGKVDRKYLYILCGYLVLIAGFRDAGADYGSYRGIYTYSDTLDYSSIIQKGLHMEPAQQIAVEWLYVLINKLLLNIFNAPFYMLTFVVAVLTIFFKARYIEDNTFYPFTFILFLFVPGFFITECGQMRQGLGVFIVYYAVRFIKERKLFYYLLCIYLAGGIHNVSYAFLPMYWVARIPANKGVMLGAIVISIFLSPFEVYRVFGSFLDSIASDSAVIGGFNAYMDETAERLNGNIGIPEILTAILTFFLFVFDTKLKEKYPYYEYHRNYALVGICFYFIFRNNPVFSSRLVGAFTGFGFLIIPNAMYVVSKSSKKMIYAFIIFMVIFNIAVFSSFRNIVSGKFTIDLYKNFLLP
ncbi:transmembrane protein EpsG [Chryseobacterium defluvii]|uniref:Transmembrane protein EpsG n=1 Tax=Chryseobacterium defluvii TaxID=160396 RepID=A0A840KMK1_9FLAO|nr:EpsG family protein [Chryseobacterium defluvii]MBB4808072.1 transmembrane protein EpsG [Chryseobacterium defluvii]